jgi:hypothetical protein
VTPLAKQIRLVAMAAMVLFLAGVAVAVARPGDLGHDDKHLAARAEVTTTTTSPPVAAATSSTSTTSTTQAGVAASGTEASGLGASGSGSVRGRGLARTGGESMLVPGLALLATALTALRLRARTTR